MRISLIISTYNWPQALNKVLESASKQSFPAFEILVADDGSGPETRAVVDSWSKKLPIRHIWHEDTGFRLSAIRNRAIAAAQGDYIVSIDGDILLHPEFLADHKRMARIGQFTTGSRVLLGPELSQQILLQGHTYTPAAIKAHADVRNKGNGMHMPWVNSLLRLDAWHLRSVRGCNMAFWRKDLLAVNGFDESFEGWGREDTDLTIRLLHAGITRKRIKFAAIGYHIFHKENDRGRLDENIRLLEESMQSKRVRALKGTDQYLD